MRKLNSDILVSYIKRYLRSIYNCILCLFERGAKRRASQCGLAAKNQPWDTSAQLAKSIE